MASILIVEPSSDLRDLFELVVAGLGHEAVYDIDVRPEEIDLLLVETGVVLGLDTARRLRAVRPDLPIVVASIFDRSIFDGLRAVVELLPSAYLVKPFHLDELEHAIATALEGG